MAVSFGLRRNEPGSIQLTVFGRLTESSSGLFVKASLLIEVTVKSYVEA